MTRNKKIIIGICIFVLIIWVIQNPIGRFGYHGFGYTVYSAIPIPYFDLKIGPDGIPQTREKSHFVSFIEVDEYIESLSDYEIILIIGTGYNGMVKVDEKILEWPNSTVIILETPEAIKKYNELKDEGKNVVIILHSSC